MTWQTYYIINTEQTSASTLFNGAYSIITNKDDLNKKKKNARIKRVLKEKGYEERIISKSFKIITNNCLNSLSTTTVCLSYKNKCKPQIPKRKRSESL